MKKFTCREMGGACDEVFTGETAEEVGKKGGQHLMSTIDEAHKSMRDQMSSATEEDNKKWWDWFNAKWIEKGEE